MPASERRITRADILSPQQYAAERTERRRAIMQIKRARRIPVGPIATFYFESFDTMLQQVLEMLHIEKGGEEQIADELAAYNPLIPNGRELCATLMFEIPDALERDRMLRTLTGVESHVFLEIGDARIAAVPEDDVERTKEDGKTSSVHFLHFPISDGQAEALKGGTMVRLAIVHPNYGHIALVPEAARAALASDLS
ncbi:MAG: DUF3501 family protein [Pseudomonadota bacterium]